MSRPPARAAKGKGSSQPVPDLSHIAAELRPLARPVAGLSVDTRNAKQHDRRSLDGLKASFKRFGQVAPIAATVDGTVMAGNGRLKAAIELGWTHIAVVTLTGSEADARMFAIADNRTSELGTVDHAQLADLMRELDESGVNLEGLGFSNDEVAALVDLDEEAPTDAPRVNSDDVLAALEGEAPRAPSVAASKAGKGRPAPPGKAARLEADPWKMLGFTDKQRKDVEAARDLVRKEKDEPDLTVAVAITTLCRRYLKERQP